MTKVLVTGATGNVGSRVVQELRDRRVSVRAFVRDPAKAAEKLGDDVELAAGDFSDTASLHRALEGMDCLFLTSADGPHKVEHETALIDAAAAAVYTQGAGRVAAAPVRLARPHRRTSVAVEGTGRHPAGQLLYVEPDCLR